MGTPVLINDGGGGGAEARVTSIGQLVTGPYAYSDVAFNEMAENDTAYNFFIPKHKEQFVITGIVAYADKQVGTTTGATVIVYEGDDDVTTTVDKTLFQIEMAQVSTVQLLPLNLLVSQGKFLNAKTDDDDIHMSIMGYYIPEL